MLAVGKTVLSIGGELALLANTWKAGKCLVQAIAEKTSAVALASIEGIGYLCSVLGWANFWGWIALGAAEMPLSSLAFVSMGIVYGARSWECWKKLSTVKSEEASRLRIAVHVTQLISKICLVAASFLGAVLVVTNLTPFLVAGLVTLVLGGISHGIALKFEQGLKEAAKG